MKQVLFSPGRDGKWPNTFQIDKLVRPGAVCRGAEVEFEAKELNGVEEGEDRMTEKAGAEVEGGGELAMPDWRVRARPRNRPTQKEREEHEATHVPIRDWCTQCMMSKGRTHHHVTKHKSED